MRDQDNSQEVYRAKGSPARRCTLCPNPFSGLACFLFHVPLRVMSLKRIGILALLQVQAQEPKKNGLMINSSCCAAFGINSVAVNITVRPCREHPHVRQDAQRSASCGLVDSITNKHALSKSWVYVISYGSQSQAVT
jgi:hypothetical protein